MSTPKRPPQLHGTDAAEKRVRLADVAQRAGVSQTAASFVLTGRREEMRISLEVEARVLEAARETGYRPNILSRSLRTGTTHTIGFVSDTIATTPFAGDLIKGALEAAHDRGRLLLIAETEGEPGLQQQLLETMIDRQVDGIVLASMYTQKIPVPAAVRSRRVVLLNAVPARPAPLISVIPDEIEAGRTAARTLLNAGHGDGIYVIGVGLGPRQRPKPLGALAATERLQGIKRTLDADGVKLAGAIPCEDWQPEFGYRAVQQLLDDGSNVRALICFNDRLAIGAYNALGDASLSIPNDVSVVSFDDDPLATWIRPQLTTIAIPHYELGRRSIERLLEATVAQGAEGQVERVAMPLRDRGSIARPAERSA
ncbi:MAG TPA: LacI family DNA-binding transcriptional regulator [Gaiellaceae bacterium]